MKKVTQKELDRIAKKKGIKIKRKFGAQPEKPEPEVKEEDALSGVDLSETSTPAPASPPEPLQLAPEPFAAMSASIAASNANTEKLIENNTKALENFRIQLAEQAANVPKRVPWRHTVKRTDKQLIKEVISTPIET
jgi:hypothetical protein